MKQIKTWEEVKEERRLHIEKLIKSHGYAIFDGDTSLDDYLSRLDTVIGIVEGSVALDSAALKALPGCNRNSEKSYPLSTLDKVLQRKEAYYGDGLLSEEDRRMDVAGIIAKSSAGVQDNYGLTVVGDKEDYAQTLIGRFEAETDFVPRYEKTHERVIEGTLRTIYEPRDGESINLQINSYASDPSNIAQVVVHAGPIDNICKHLKIVAGYVKDMKLKAHFGGACKGNPHIGVLYEP